MSQFSKLLLKFGLAILLINALGMWIFVFLDHQNLVRLQELNNLPSKNTASVQKSTDLASELDLRVKILENSQEQLVNRVDGLESSVSAQAKTSVIRPVSAGSSTGTKAQKEYTIYLGEGSTINRDWTTVQSTTIALDTKKYPGLSAVYFESALSIAGGEATAQLIDVESGAILSETALLNNNPTATWKSQKVNLESGNHMYVVQLRSSSGELATLSGARLRIIAD